MKTITVSFSGSSRGSLTDLTEKLTVLKKNARQDSEYVSGIVLIKKKKIASLIQNVLRKRPQ